MNIERADGRTANQIRPLACEQGLLNRADGSARFSHNKTSVIVAVYGPGDVKPWNEKLDRCVLEVNYKPVSGQPTSREKERELLIRRSLEDIILTSLHPRTQINVIVQEIMEDGSSLAAAWNATCVALLDAGIPMRGLPLAVSCGITPDGDVYLDLDSSEEKSVKASGTMLFSVAGGLNENDDATPASEAAIGVLSMDIRGSGITPEENLLLLTHAEKCVGLLAGFVRLTMTKNVKLSNLVRDS
eukprot:TRINITY_DN8027_c0_g1::TRINITY_DN8027_c0_g1_i1::g.20140::m.20140 TRINITY_DN8027_c0_g1::TRINITY_DN8027_c0_g1_i1::g.20140  ORF type:complete len:244 (+),score=33.61,sp/Q9LX74/EXOS5_ARATH/43.27/2e-43,RNase_PH/PF01138.16/4.1e-28,RNase_PH_C/PF03725.10/0.087 TRINITY_DN8027_c0_g1_i1:69-800(+)